MRIEVLEQSGLTLTMRVTREQGQFPNNIVETVTIAADDAQGLTDDEIKTLGYIKIKPIAERVFAAIEPLDEPENPVGFALVPARTVKTEVFAPDDVFVGELTTATKHIFDQYGRKTYQTIEIDTSAISTVTVEGKTVNVIQRPAPQPTEEDYLLDLDYRLSLIELGV